MSTEITIVGQLGADPELRYLPNGPAVASIRIADTPRRMDKATNQWVNGETLWINAEAWEGLAVNVANSLKKGDRVIVVGKLVADSYEDKKTGEKRFSQKLRIDSIGPELRFATTVVTRNPREGGNNGGGRPAQQSAPAGNQWQAPAGQDDDTPF